MHFTIGEENYFLTRDQQTRILFEQVVSELAERKIDFGIRLKGENVQYWRIPKDIPMMEGCSEALFE